MRSILTITVFAIALTTAFATKTSLAGNIYSLKTIEANPIPKAEHFQLWKDAGLQLCAREEWSVRLGLSESECREVVSKRANRCAQQLSSESPDVIKTTAASQQIARGFLKCAMPYPQCNGREVKTEAEALQHCR